SIPALDAAEAVEAAFDELGPLLIAIPDGETAERKAWVAAIIDRLSSNPDFALKKSGRWTTYEDIPRYRVRRGQRIDPSTLKLGYLDAYRESAAVVERVAARHHFTPPPFQVGIVSAFDLALFSMGLWAGLRHRGAF